MSSKKLGGLDKKLGSKRLNIATGNETLDKAVAVSRGLAGDISAENVLELRGGESGTSSVARDERLAGEAAAQGERDKLKLVQDEATRKQQEIDAQNAQDEEARKKLREAQGGGYAANVLAGGKNFGYGSGARRRLSGS